MSTSSLNLANEPDTISIGKGMSMTFLRNSDYLMRTTISGEEPLVVPLHWHQTHDELFRIIKGRVEYTIGERGSRTAGRLGTRTESKVYTPEDGEIVIPRGTVHSIRTFPGEECIVEERTEPMDEEKEVFFRNIFSAGGLSASPLAVMQTFYWGDGLPALPGGIPWLEKAFVALLGYYIAPLLGYKLKYDNTKKI